VESLKIKSRKNILFFQVFFFYKAEDHRSPKKLDFNPIN